MLVTVDAKISVKVSTTPGELPTIPTSDDHTDGTWNDTDIYSGEFFLNEADDKLFFRSGSVLKELEIIAAGPVDFAEIHMQGNATSTDLSVGVPTKIAGTFSAGEKSAAFDTTTVNGRIQYTGTATKKFKAFYMGTGIKEGGTSTFSFSIAKNGVVVAKSALASTVGERNGAQCIIELATNDYVEAYLENESNNTDFLQEDMNFILTEVR